jgi:thiol:disulfide interchange protein DsbC
MPRFIVVAVFTLFAINTSLAAEPDLAKVKAELAKHFPDVAAGTLRPGPVPGLLELQVDGDVLYVSNDGKYVLLGDVVEVATKKNLTGAVREKAAHDALEKMGESNMIVMAPATTKRTITVFTDVDCPYCAALHRDVPELNRNGVKVRYLLFPRGGLDSETYRRSVAVWCADDRVKAIGIAKAGGKIEMKTCANPVERHYKLGQSLGVGGTPTIFLDDGRKVGGYVPAAQLLAALGIKSDAAAAKR